MSTKIILIIVPLIWVVVLIWTIYNRPLGNVITELPRDGLLLLVTFLLVVVFAVYVAGVDLDLTRVGLAKTSTQDRFINFLDISPDVGTIRNVFRLDADNDKSKEWIVFIKHEAKAYSAAVYDVEQCRFPRIVTYPLSPVDNDYVAEEMYDSYTNPWSGPIMSDLDGALSQPALVIHSRDGQTLNIFQWVDQAGRTCEAAESDARKYQVIGTFRGSGGVTLNGKRVVVKDRNGFERSQLALERTYEPEAGTFLQLDGSLRPPVEAKVTFQFDQAKDLRSTFYPEKAVLAFYLALFQKDGAKSDAGTNWQSQDYLSKDKLTLENQASDAPYALASSTFGLAGERSAMKEARVVGISYAPDVSAERAHLPREVTVEAVAINHDGQIIGPLRYITWKVIAEPRPDAAPCGCEWKLDEMVRVE
ncbi:MAG: hypothetical protein NT169_02795 [Chloroflexi bacterium]|nr:hypothetical protein [Chloroflexota bacterium]